MTSNYLVWYLNLVFLFSRNLKSTQSHIRLNMVICLATAQVVFMTGISATGEKVKFIK